MTCSDLIGWWQSLPEGRAAVRRLMSMALSRLLQIAVAWRGRFASMEINPLLVRPRGTGVATLDAVIVTPTDR
jgi:succinyl-CoA synthetase beta subunit